LNFPWGHGKGRLAQSAPCDQNHVNDRQAVAFGGGGLKHAGVLMALTASREELIGAVRVEGDARMSAA